MIVPLDDGPLSQIRTDQRRYAAPSVLRSERTGGAHAVMIALLALVSLVGCASRRRGVPARSMQSHQQCDACGQNEPINFLTLRQDPPQQYRVGARDVLGIYIEGILGDRDQPMPVHFPEDKSQQPAVGYPTPVRDDGTISLPLVAPIFVEGQTIAEVERTILERYGNAEILLEKQRQRIIVTLMKRRTYQVLVVREDQGVPTTNITTESLMLSTNKRGMSYAVDLPAYENDVLHALTETGGLPGNDAKNELIVLRGGFDPAQQRLANVPVLIHPVSGEEITVDGEIVTMDGLPSVQLIDEDLVGDDSILQPVAPAEEFSLREMVSDGPVVSEGAIVSEDTASIPFQAAPQLAPQMQAVANGNIQQYIAQHGNSPNVTRIPLRSGNGMMPQQLSQQDVVLKTGDIVFVQSREKEVFYTGGVLPGGQYPLPRDYKIDVLEAIAMAGASVGSSAGSNNMSGIGSGMFPATRVTILRRRGHQQIPIEVDLRRAFQDPRERIKIEPGDFITLEYRRSEMMTNLLLSTFRLNWFLSGIN